MPSTAYRNRNKFFDSSDYNWYRKVREAEATIARIEGRLATRQFCDKWGEPLVVGDNTNRGVLTAITGWYGITREGKFHFSHLRKVDNVNDESFQNLHDSR